jgi:hypothetical protein
VHRFSAIIQRLGTLYCVVVPADVARALGGRGRIPVAVSVAGCVPFHGTLMPRRDGRHVLRLNAEARGGAGADHRLVIELTAADPKREVAAPDDLAAGLREAGAASGWQALPPGKREHIVRWIEEATFEATRAKRVALAVETAAGRAEKDRDRAARRAR